MKRNNSLTCLRTCIKIKLSWWIMFVISRYHHDKIQTKKQRLNVGFWSIITHLILHLFFLCLLVICLSGPLDTKFCEGLDINDTGLDTR